MFSPYTFILLFLFVPYSIANCISNPCPFSGSPSADSGSTLRLIHVLFRHGDRTPTSGEQYPLDPYLDEKYYPFGLGQLTSKGKRTEYSLGKVLRTRYNTFLGPEYVPEILSALTTDYSRTKASLELVLAGLFPPKGLTTWNNELNWQPIPYDYMPLTSDKILVADRCPNYIKLYDEYKKSPQQLNLYQKYRDIFDYVSNSTGLNTTTFTEMYNLFFCLRTESDWGLKLPQWTRTVWPKTVTKLAIQEYYTTTATTQLRRISSGYLLRKIVNDTDDIMSNNHNTKKLYLYSAHENNLAQMLILLDCFDQNPHVPDYGAHLIFEVHQIDSKQYGFKIYYASGALADRVLLKMPGCEEICEFNQFIQLVEEYIPKGNECGSSQ